MTAVTVVLRFSSMSLPCHYIGVGTTQEVDFNKSDLLDVGMNLFLNPGRAQPIFKNVKPLPENVAMEAAPSSVMPDLSVSRLSDRHQLLITDVHEKRWKNHPQFQSDYEDLMAYVLKELPPNADMPVEPAQKKQRVADAIPLNSESCCVDASSLDKDKMLATSICQGKLKGLELQVFSESAVYLVNAADKSSAAIAISPSAFICGFKNGKWINLKSAKNTDEEFKPDTDILLQFTDPDAPMNVEKNMTTLREIIRKRSETEPDKAILRYHKMTESPAKDDPGNFTVSPTHEICFRVETVTCKVEQDAAATASKTTLQTQVGSLLPVHCWDQTRVQIVWMMRWTKAGLTGVRPCVHMKGPVIVEPGKAMKLTM